MSAIMSAIMSTIMSTIMSIMSISCPTHVRLMSSPLSTKAPTDRTNLPSEHADPAMNGLVQPRRRDKKAAVDPWVLYRPRCSQHRREQDAKEFISPSADVREAAAAC
ncbi:hypothetical protein E4U41_001582 [Claviceps citrina]|nr:hypothetical protein E4U41_001582 [Claviceps citrina]